MIARFISMVLGLVVATLSDTRRERVFQPIVANHGGFSNLSTRWPSLAIDHAVTRSVTRTVGRSCVGRWTTASM
jgi:hypothetical protein